MQELDILTHQREWKRKVEEDWIHLGGSRESFEKFRRLPLLNQADFENATDMLQAEMTRIGLLHSGDLQDNQAPRESLVFRRSKPREIKDYPESNFDDSFVWFMMAALFIVVLGIFIFS